MIMTPAIHKLNSVVLRLIVTKHIINDVKAIEITAKQRNYRAFFVYKLHTSVTILQF